MHVKLDDGFESQDVLHPGNVAMDANFVRDDSSMQTPGSQSNPFYYKNGVGGQIVNHCYESDYPSEDPCFEGLSSGVACTVRQTSSFSPILDKNINLLYGITVQ